MRGLFALLLLATITCSAQRNVIYDVDNIASLQCIAQDDALLPPIMKMKDWRVTISFDELSHDYHRYRYHIDHCEADWEVSEDLFESNFLNGLNDQLIEDYEKSLNTTQIYTHYTLSLPNEYVRLTLSGNYRVTIYDDDNGIEDPVATVEFALVEPLMSIGMNVTSNTDIDFQRSNQQVNLSVAYGALRVSDPDRELHTYVIQNRRQDRRVEVKPNIKKANGIEFTHQRDLIFPATNECHKFEFLSLHRTTLNIDNIRWFDPYFHVTLFEEHPCSNYSFETDQNGAYIIRNSDNDDDETGSEYAFVHFRLKSEPIGGGDVYVQGNWCNDWPNDTYKMEYDAQNREYHAAIYLKQGYYNYRFVQLSGKETVDGTPIAITDRTDGNFYQTENEYQVLVYYRQPGSRYDRLVGYNAAKIED